MKIDVLAAANQYGTGVHFAKGLAAALERLEVSTRLFWVDDGHFFHALHAILGDPPDLTCSFADISLNKKPLGELWQIPHLSWLIDPPIYFLHQLQGSYSYAACVDAEDLAFITRLGFPRGNFLPHGADVYHLTPVKVDRPYEKVFFGTCVDYEAIAEHWPKEIRELLLAASAKVLSPAGITVLQALGELGVSPENLPYYHGEVDRFTRGKDRVELIRSLKDPVHIWGEGPWEKYLPGYPIHPPVSFDQALNIMKQSRVVLNSTPRFKAGAHERIFYALLCGAAVYTGENRYLTAELPELYTYLFGEWETPSFDHWAEVASAGQERVIASHTWDARAASLLKLFSLS